MKRIVFALSFTFLCGIIFTSCKKCSTCSYTYKFIGKDSTRTYPEECGSKKELENYKLIVNADAATDNGAVVTCTE